MVCLQSKISKWENKLHLRLSTSRENNIIAAVSRLLFFGRLFHISVLKDFRHHVLKNNICNISNISSDLWLVVLCKIDNYRQVSRLGQWWPLFTAVHCVWDAWLSYHASHMYWLDVRRYCQLFWICTEKQCFVLPQSHWSFLLSTDHIITMSCLFCETSKSLLWSLMYIKKRVIFSSLQGFSATSPEVGTAVLPGIPGANSHRPACPESGLCDARIHTVWVCMNKDTWIHVYV